MPSEILHSDFSNIAVSYDSSGWEPENDELEADIEERGWLEEEDWYNGQLYRLGGSRQEGETVFLELEETD
ncbi:MAG: hypothetical protein ABEJ83_02360 [Candidatus Nanohaloarchaea archaeon]